MEILFIITSFFIATLVCVSVKNRTTIEFVSVTAALFAFIESIIVAKNVAYFGNYTPFPFFLVDALGALMMLIISCVGFATVVYSVQYLREETAKSIIGFTRVKQYFILLNLFLAAMFVAASSNSPILALISVEATTLSTAFLISFYNKPSAVEAAWKYLIINSIGLLLGFLGTLLYFTSLSTTGESGLTNWQGLLDNAVNVDPLVIKIAFIFVLIGFGTKVGLAPMHTWLPDAHSKAPVPISALLSGVLLNVAFIVVLRFKLITDLSIGSDFSQKLLIAFGLLSILVASLIIFTQKSYKRLIAYSSIENMGITALGFGFGGLGVFAAILHMIYHSLIKSALFLSAGNIFLRYSSTKIANIRGAMTALPITSTLFLTGFFAITGAPPFGIFLTKLFIFSSGIMVHPIITIVVIFSTAILFIGFFKHVCAMIFGEKPDDIKSEKENIWLIIPPLTLIVLALYLSFNFPSFIYTLVTTAVSQY